MRKLRALDTGVLKFIFRIHATFFISQDYRVYLNEWIHMKQLVKIFCLCLIVVLCSCESEPLGKMNINQQVLDEDLYNLVLDVSDTEGENAISCIKFNYSFVIFVFDAEMEFTESVPIRSDLEFSTFLGNLDETYSISLNYPISGTLNNGELVEINTNEELKEAIDACRAEELKRKCNRTLVDCIWKVGVLEGQANEYEGAYYKLRYDGSIQFHYKNHIFFGTWITLFIGDELYLNIDLNDDDAIEDFWDLNWVVDLRSDDRIEINDGNTQVLIEKDCSIPCVETGYRQCELEGNPGVAEFILEDYTPCIPVPYTHDKVSAVSVSFYETEEDALLGINPIDTNTYENTSNPQTIYVRMAYRESGELLHFAQILIEAVPCT